MNRPEASGASSSVAAPSSDDDSWLSATSNFVKPRLSATHRGDVGAAGATGRLARLAVATSGAAELRSISSSFEHEYSSDLRYTLTERADWSRTASRELETIAEDGRIDSIASLKYGQLRQLVASRRPDPEAFTDKTLSFDHKQARNSEKRLRWPLEADQVPLPAWPLAKELESVLLRQLSSKSRARQEVPAANLTSGRDPSRKRRRTQRDPPTNADVESAVQPPQVDRDDARAGLAAERLQNNPDFAHILTSTSLSVQHRLRQVYELLGVQEAEWQSKPEPKRQQTEQSASAEDPRASLGLAADTTGRFPTAKWLQQKRPADWRNVLAFVAHRSESTVSGAYREAALDRALQSTYERLERVYGTAALSASVGRPNRITHFAKTGDFKARLHSRDAAMMRADASLAANLLSSRRPGATAHLEHPVKYEIDVGLLDQSDLLVDHEGAGRMRPAPSEQLRETWPLPSLQPDLPRRIPMHAHDQDVLDSSTGPLLLPRPVRASRATLASACDVDPEHGVLSLAAPSEEGDGMTPVPSTAAGSDGRTSDSPGPDSEDGERDVQYDQPSNRLKEKGASVSGDASRRGTRTIAPSERHQAVLLERKSRASGRDTDRSRVLQKRKGTQGPRPIRASSGF